MSKELAPLLAGCVPSQARPSVYRGSKGGSIDRCILVAICNARKSKRLQTIRRGASSVTWKVTLATISSTRPSANETRLKKSSHFWPVDLELEVIGCKCVKLLLLDNSQRRKTGCSNQTLWKGCVVRDSLMNLSPPSVMKSCSALLKVSATLPGDENFPLTMCPRPLYLNQPPWNPRGSPQGNCNESDPNLHNPVIPVMPCRQGLTFLCRYTRARWYCRKEYCTTSSEQWNSQPGGCATRCTLATRCLFQL